MPKNKNKPNAFLFFMLDWKKAEERKGRTFPNGLKDVQVDPDCNEKWRSLSDEEKAHYKAMKKTCKGNPDIKKRTGLGELLSDIEKSQLKHQEFLDNMAAYMSLLINSAKDHDCVHKLQFFVIHINFYYSRTTDNNEVEYYPAEISIIEFSVGEGITREYHQIVNEKIRTGFAHTAKEHSGNTHLIPINSEFGKSNYQEIFRDICQFLEPGKKNKTYPPLYTLFFKEDVYYPAKYVLSRLAAADGKSEDSMLLYSFEDLFANIHNAAIEQIAGNKIEPIVAVIELKKDPFAYKYGLECDFHNHLKGGILHCSQSCVKRWIFVLCSYCCDPLGITMIPGKHMPKENPELIDSFAYLNSTLSSICLSESRRTNSTLSMSGVSRDYRQRVSERSIKDEQNRKVVSKSIEIIDHSKLNHVYKQVDEPIQRPLRAPHTKSAVPDFDTTDTESIDFSENSFPSIGRGSIVKKRMQENKSSVGHGYAARLKF